MEDKPLDLKHIDTQTNLTYIKQNLDLIMEKLEETQSTDESIYRFLEEYENKKQISRRKTK